MHCLGRDGGSSIGAMGAQPATASPLVRRYTLEEFWELEAPPEGGHYELIAGVLYVVPPPTGPHNIAISNLTGMFIRYLDAHPGAGRLFVPRAAVWRPDWVTWLEPDLFLVTAERLRTTDAGRLATADLVVEALSPGSATYDRTAKADTYAALGVRELWLVDLERKAIEQRVLEAGRWRVLGVHAGSAAFESAVFPGLIVLPADVFASA